MIADSLQYKYVNYAPMSENNRWPSMQCLLLGSWNLWLKLLAAGKLLYKASALPLPVKHARKFEAAMNRFLWIGRLEKLKIDEIKNTLLSGGLNLPCVISKSDSLLMSLICRLLKTPTSKHYLHLKY